MALQLTIYQTKGSITRYRSRYIRRGELEAAYITLSPPRDRTSMRLEDPGAALLKFSLEIPQLNPSRVRTNLMRRAVFGPQSQTREVAYGLYKLLER